jgi:hypothetical protein
MLRVRDRIPGGDTIELDVDLDAGRLSAAELIRGRVAAELARRGGETVRPLVETTAEEFALNGARPDGAPNPERETARALDAFRRGRFVLLVDGRHVVHEDDVVTLTPDTDVTFLRLVPLQGG